MKYAHKYLPALFVAFLTVTFASETLLAQDWQRYRQDIRQCASDDATCVGLTIIDIMQELHHRRDYQVNCTCSDRNRITELSCVVTERGIRQVIPERIPFTFTSNCRDELESAREKWAFCTDRSRNDYTLYTINPRNLTFDVVGRFTFRSDCHEALGDL